MIRGVLKASFNGNELLIHVRFFWFFLSTKTKTKQAQEKSKTTLNIQKFSLLGDLDTKTSSGAT